MKDLNTNTQIEMPKEKLLKKKYVIGTGILILILLAVAAIFLLGQNKNRKTDVPETKKIAPVVSPAPAQKQANLMSRLPYKTDSYVIEYFPYSSYYSFRLKGSTYEQIKKNRDAAYAWIKNNDGFKNNEFCAFKYNIFFQYIVDDQKTEELTVLPDCSSK